MHLLHRTQQTAEYLTVSIHTLGFPRHIQLQTHRKCNMACASCPHPLLERNQDRSILSEINFERLMAEACSHIEFKELVLDLQNEPLIDRFLESRVSYIRKLRPDLFIGITTNGLLLTPQRFKSLVDAGLNRIVFSLNALDGEVFTKLVPNVPYEKIVDNLRNILKVPNARKFIKISFGVCETNYQQAADFILDCEIRNIPYRYFALHDRISTVKNMEFLKFVPEKTCHIPLYSMAIEQDGSVLICCQDWTSQKVMGNALNTSISAVWNHPEYQQIRYNLIHKEKLPEIPCKGCSGAYRFDDNLPFNWKEISRTGMRFFNSEETGMECHIRENQALSGIAITPHGKNFAIFSQKNGHFIKISEEAALAFERLKWGSNSKMSSGEEDAILQIVGNLRKKDFPKDSFPLKNIRFTEIDQVFSGQVSGKYLLIKLDHKQSIQPNDEVSVRFMNGVLEWSATVTQVIDTTYGIQLMFKDSDLDDLLSLSRLSL